MANYKRKKKNIKLFGGSKQERKANKRFLIVVVAVLLVVASASAITYFKERSREEALVDEGDVTRLASSNAEEAGILFIGTTGSSTEREVVFLICLTLNPSDTSFNVTCLKPSAGLDPTKPSELLEKVRVKNNIKLDRYVLITQDGFKKFSQIIGGYEVNLKNTIDYSDKDFSLRLRTGEQTLYGNLFFNYVRFLGLNGTEHELEEQGEVIADYINQILTPSTVENGEEIFSKLSNVCQTDITIVDFSKYQSFMTDAVSKKLMITVGTEDKKK